MPIQFRRFNSMKILLAPDGKAFKWSQVVEQDGFILLRTGNLFQHQSIINFIIESEIVEPYEAAEEFLYEHQSELSQYIAITKEELLSRCIPKKQTSDFSLVRIELDNF